MNLSGNPFDFVIAFFGGVLVSCTPCVYPLIPAGAAYITGSAQASRLKGFLLSLAYVSGISVTYASLGVAAVATGTIFGNFTSAPLMRLAVGVIILFFGLSMLGVFHLQLPAIKAGALRKRNYLATFFFGVLSGLAISPCLTPVLGAILAYLATKRNILYGWMLLFSFAYGMGLIFIVIGTFGPFLSRMPKLGRWMARIKNISAFIILLTGVYFVYTALIRF